MNLSVVYSVLIVAGFVVFVVGGLLRALWPDNEYQKGMRCIGCGLMAAGLVVVVSVAADALYSAS